MKETFPIIFYTVFGLSTFIVLLIIYKDMDNSFSVKFVIFYAIFLLLSFIYFIIVTVIEMRKLKWSNIRKRILKFITYFFIFSGINIFYDYLFKLETIQYGTFSIPLGLSLGITFFDLLFSEGKK